MQNQQSLETILTVIEVKRSRELHRRNEIKVNYSFGAGVLFLILILSGFGVDSSSPAVKFFAYLLNLGSAFTLSYVVAFASASSVIANELENDQKNDQREQKDLPARLQKAQQDLQDNEMRLESFRKFCLSIGIPAVILFVIGYVANMDYPGWIGWSLFYLMCITISYAFFSASLRAFYYNSVAELSEATQRKAQDDQELQRQQQEAAQERQRQKNVITNRYSAYIKKHNAQREVESLQQQSQTPQEYEIHLLEMFIHYSDGSENRLQARLDELKGKQAATEKTPEEKRAEDFEQIMKERVANLSGEWKDVLRVINWGKSEEKKLQEQKQKGEITEEEHKMKKEVLDNIINSELSNFRR